MKEGSPCDECSLHSIEHPVRIERCRSFVQDVIHQWWHGDPTIDLNDAVMDNYRHVRDFSEDEKEQMGDCFSEHSSDRCQNLNP